MSNVGLYLGTFNPIHNGHVTLAEYFSNLSELDEVLVVISPQSPFKKEDELISDIDRLKMAETVFKKFDNVRVSDIEFKMSKPNFTIDTLKEFKKRHKYNKLILLIGEDNLVGFNKWKDYKSIFKQIHIAVFNRGSNNDQINNCNAGIEYSNFKIENPGESFFENNLPSWTFISDFNINISSSDIRK